MWSGNKGVLTLPQARLPDINAAFTKHRNEVTAGLKSKDFDTVFGGLYALNALLPDTVDEDDPSKLKYRVVISDLEYNKLTKHTIYVQCYHCEKDSMYSKVIKFEMKPKWLVNVITRIKKDKVWICPECNKINRLEKTRKDDLMAETQMKEPYYLGVVPKPPSRKDGLTDRTSFNKKAVQWAWTFLNELEAKMAAFRDDNWTKNEQVGFGGDTIEDSGEESD